MSSQCIYNIPSLQMNDVHRTTSLVRRSRFITSFAHVSTAEAAKTFIEKIKKEFPDATHNCWAFTLGAPGDTAHIGFSDDGEPHGTAGRPMLTILLHSGLGEIAVVVTRYFGGIKLGVGGLVRAYQGAVQQSLQTLPFCQKITLCHAKIRLAYTHIEGFKRVLKQFSGKILEEEFAMEALFYITLPKENLSSFFGAVKNMTLGCVHLQKIDFFHDITM